MKPIHVGAVTAACVIGLAVFGGQTNASSYPEDIDWLTTALNGLTLEFFGHTPGELSLAFEAGEDGAVVVRQTVERDQPGLGFHSTTEQSWHFYLRDLDRKRVQARFDPPAVFAPVKGKPATYPRRIRVERSETKTAGAGVVEPAETWTEADRFTTSFIAIPVTDAAMAERVADALRRAIKSAPEPER